METNDLDDIGCSMMLMIGVALIAIATGIICSCCGCSC